MYILKYVVGINQRSLFMSLLFMLGSNMHDIWYIVLKDQEQVRVAPFLPINT